MPGGENTNVTDFYAVIGVAPTASPEEIRRTYGEKAQEAMQDRTRFQSLSEAYEVLKDPARRAAYDRQLLLSSDTVERPSPPPVNPASPVSPAASATRMGGYSPMGVADATAVIGSTMQSGSLPVSTLQMPGSGAIPLPVVCPMEVSPCPLITGAVAPDEGFCPECGFMLGSSVGMAVQQRLLPKLVDVQGREFPLKHGNNLVGRSGEVDVLIPHQTVSKRHARIVVEDTGRITLEDLQSTNGTKVEGVNVPAHQRTGLSDRMPLQFGAVKLTLIVPAVEELAALPSPEAAVTNMPVAALAAPEGANSSARLVSASGEVQTLVAARTTFGRRQGNTLVITGDSYVSGNHAEIVYRDDAFFVTDLGSTNGTFLNRQRLEPNQTIRLTDGDAVTFGQTHFTFRGPGAR